MGHIRARWQTCNLAGRLMKRSAALPDVASSHWPHGPETWKQHAGHGLEDQTRVWQGKIRVSSLFIILFPDFFQQERSVTKIHKQHIMVFI